MVEKLHFHILPTAAQMSGVAMTVLTLFYYLKVSTESIADETLTFSVLLFVGATVISYLGIRHERYEQVAERIADWLFLAGLGCLLVTSFILTFVIF